MPLSPSSIASRHLGLGKSTSLLVEEPTLLGSPQFEILRPDAPNNLIGQLIETTQNKVPLLESGQRERLFFGGKHEPRLLKGPSANQFLNDLGCVGDATLMDDRRLQLCLRL